MKSNKNLVKQDIIFAENFLLIEFFKYMNEWGYEMTDKHAIDSFVFWLKEDALEVLRMDFGILLDDIDKWVLITRIEYSIRKRI